MQLRKVNNKARCRLAARLSFKGSSGRRFVAWAHAHVILKSHFFRLPGRLAWEAHCWVAGTASYGSANQPLNISGTQPPFRNVVANAQSTVTTSLPFRAFLLWVVFEIEWKIFIKLLWRWSQTLALFHAG